MLFVINSTFFYRQRTRIMVETKKVGLFMLIFIKCIESISISYVSSVWYLFILFLMLICESWLEVLFILLVINIIMDSEKDFQVKFLRRMKSIELIDKVSPQLGTNYKTDYAKRLSNMLYELELKDDHCKWT